MYKHILERAGDISGMALIPLVIFFLVFTGSLILAMLRNTRDMDQLSRLPFDDASPESNEIDFKL
jgi:hypothetical protein